MTETAVKARSSTKLPHRVHIQRSDGSVDFISWDEAFALNQKGKAEFLSRKKLKGQSDKAVKELMRTKNKPEKKVEVEAKAETKKAKKG